MPTQYIFSEEYFNYGSQIHFKALIIYRDYWSIRDGMLVFKLIFQRFPLVFEISNIDQILFFNCFFTKVHLLSYYSYLYSIGIIDVQVRIIRSN